MTLRLCDCCERKPASLLATFEQPQDEFPADDKFEVCVSCASELPGEALVIELVAVAG